MMRAGRTDHENLSARQPGNWAVMPSLTLSRAIREHPRQKAPGLGAELVEFVAVGVGLVFGAFGPGTVGAQLVAVGAP
jgi:hypothetical protein